MINLGYSWSSFLAPRPVSACMVVQLYMHRYLLHSHFLLEGESLSRAFVTVFGLMVFLVASVMYIRSMHSLLTRVLYFRTYSGKSKTIRTSLSLNFDPKVERFWYICVNQLRIVRYTSIEIRLKADNHVYNLIGSGKSGGLT